MLPHVSCVIPTPMVLQASQTPWYCPKPRLTTLWDTSNIVLNQRYPLKLASCSLYAASLGKSTRRGRCKIMAARNQFRLSSILFRRMRGRLTVTQTNPSPNR